MTDFDTVVTRYGAGSIKWEQYGTDDVLALSTADMDFQCAPCIRTALKKCTDKGLYAYEYKADSYYQAIIEWYERNQGIAIQKEWILNAPGVWPASRICMGTYAKPGDSMILQAPHFFPILNNARHAGLSIITNPMVQTSDGTYRVDLEDFRRKIEEYRPAIYFMVNTHNPTGHAFTREEVIALAEICKTNGTVLISDEVHANVMFDEKEAYSVLALPEQLRDMCVLISSPSKAFNVMGLTYAILVISGKNLRPKYEEAMIGFGIDFATNIFSMATVEAAFSAEGDAWRKELNAYLQTNLDALCRFVEERMPIIKVIRPDGSYLVWLDFRGLRMTPEELQHLILEEAKVGLTWGEGYGAEGEGFERINIGCPRKTLIAALERIARALAAHGFC